MQYGADDRASTVLCTYREGCPQRFEYEYADDGYEMRIRQLDGATLISDATYQYDREDGALLAQHVEEHFKLDGSEVVRITEDGYELDDQHRVVARHQRVEQGPVFQAQDSEWRYASDGVIDRYIGRYTSNDPQYDDVMLQTYQRCD